MLVRLTPSNARTLLYLVIERLCEIDKNWSRKANAERKRLEPLRGALEDALIECRQGGDAG
jgi:hypothetical protein